MGNDPVISATKVLRAIAATLLVTVAACSKPAAESEARSDLPSVIGKRIEFKQGGDSEAYRVSGWSKTEEKFTWNEGTSAKLSLPIGTDGGPWLLKVTMSGLVHPPDLASQPVQVYANEQKVTDWDVVNTADFAATIPASANKAGGKLDIEFRVPKATTPKSLGQNEDARVLGICVQSVELDKS
jgi:hypothetical protein